jgi:CDP-4-dehydro-6-deoxyglucose reductase
MRVNLSKSDRSFDVAPGESLLDAALEAGVNVPHGCLGGNCGACRARLIAGEVSYPNGARGDVAIETFAALTPDQIKVKRLPCRVERSERLAHDVMGLYLRLPAAERFDFKPGQYLDILLPKGRRRSFSIASPPHDSRLLELHVRRAPGGEFTEQVFSEGIRGALLTIEGPLGDFVYRETPPGAGRGDPLLLIGGGTGLAPLKSIVRHVVENGLPREMTLYWGVRSERDLYAHADLQEIARRDPRLRYVPVLSQASAAWTGYKGLVHERVLDTVSGLERYETYASGPPQMIEAVRREFHLRGVDGARLRFDSFDYAPDSAARQRTRADTSS